MNNFQDPENPNINQDKQPLMGQQARGTFLFNQIHPNSFYYNITYETCMAYRLTWLDRKRAK